MTILGRDFDFSIGCPDDVRRLAEAQEAAARAFAAMADGLEDARGLAGYERVLRQGCAAVFELFDRLLGEGTANALFGPRCDYRRCLEACGELEQALSDQAGALSDTLARYRPETDRPEGGDAGTAG